ncbi:MULTISPECIES: isocitrate lyase/PEP mutase family protein [unclassified Legionella]|uniref:isocitrate lyase/PEP mutase family protein n=1 Tax=unclassified Legionella TaxID=2622702 RepID=UPI001056CA81|nr:MULTISPECIES: isocitrate lyase/PEP mutase family protein [unclassified Legionella]MDI9819338.1 isocitrate lyase/PEP mutase family protein [Legionella sp. PL877]
MSLLYGQKLRQLKNEKKILPFIGIYDVFSASLVANYHNCLFVSGFGFAASHYGLPDIGFNTWSDLLNYVMRIRSILPDAHILVDIDDGFVDIHNAKMITACLYDAGASGIILEDQSRPRRCGHYNGKTLVSPDNYIKKLEEVMSVSGDLFVVARTDATQMEEILERVSKMKALPVDSILVDGMSVEQLCSLDVLYDLRKENKIAYNQIAGGKSSPHNLTELEECGIGLAIFSTPCLFSAQHAIQKAMQQLMEHDFLLSKISPSSVLEECTEVLNKNMSRRFKKNGAV